MKKMEFLARDARVAADKSVETLEVAKQAVDTANQTHDAFQVLQVKVDGRLAQLLDEKEARGKAEVGKAAAEAYIAGGEAKVAEIAAIKEGS